MVVTGLMKIGQHALKQPSAHVCESLGGVRGWGGYELKSKLGETDVPEGCLDRDAYERVKKESLGGRFFEGDIWLIHLKSHTLVFTQRG